MGSNAVFTEVLQIGIDTSVFAAQMKEVETIYANSIKNMPELGAVGTTSMGKEMQAVAADFTSAAKKIEVAAASVTEDVSIMVSQSNANMATMAEKAQENAAKAASSLTKSTSVMEKFGDQLVRSAVRIPAMLLVGTAIAGIFEAVRAPIDFVVEGLHNLEAQSTSFQETRLQLTNIFGSLASVAATPIFDLLLSQMKELAKWLQDNKVFVDNLALGFGQMAAALISTTVEFAKLDVIKESLKGLATILIYGTGAISGLINKFGTLAGILSEFGHKDFYTISGGESNKRINALLDNYVKQEDQNAAAIVQAIDALNGKANANIPNIQPPTENKAPGEVVAEFRLKLSDIRTASDEQLRAIDKQVSDQLINLTEASNKKTSILEKERGTISTLIDKYKDLAAQAVRREDLGHATENPEKTEQHIRAIQETIQRGSIGGQGSYNKSITGQETVAYEKAAKERADIDKAEHVAALKLQEQSYKAEVELVKKAVSEGHMTREAGVLADIGLEKIRHEATIAELSTRKAAPGSLDETNKQNSIDTENQKNNDANTALQRALTDARRQDTIALDAYYAAIAKNNIALKEEAAQEQGVIGNKTKQRELLKEIIALKIAETQAELDAAKARFQEDQGTPKARADEQQIATLQARIATLQNQKANATFSSTEIGKQQRAAAGGLSIDLNDELKSALHLEEVAQDMQNARGSLQQFSVGLEGAVVVIGDIKNAISNAVSAYQSGGALGAAGSLLQDKSVDKGITKGVGSLLGTDSPITKMVGQALPLVGSALSLVTSFFSAGIQKMVDTINNKISDINNKASLGQITLSDQIKDLQAEKQDAISQLGGSKKKGAKDELSKILKSLNQEIAELQKQQKEIITNFNQAVLAASLGSSVMTDWYKTWTQINQEVKQYVDAGGSLATAAQFLNQQLQQQQAKLQDDLNDGNQTAIQDAINLNSLLKQRVQMMKDEAATEFGLLNADSTERRTSNAVKLGTELSKQRALFADQLTDVNNQISLGEQKVALEGKVFDINKSLADLQASSNALTLHSLNEQLAKYQDMATLLAATKGMVFGPGNIPTAAGATLPIPGEPTVNGPVVAPGGGLRSGVGNNSHPIADPGVSGGAHFYSGAIVVQGDVSAQNAATLGKEIARNIRSGVGFGF